MRVQTKIIFLLLSLAIVFAGVFLVHARIQQHTLQLVVKQEERDLNLLFDKLLGFKGRGAEIFAKDYTYWDEMVSFVNDYRNRNEWGKQNIDSGLSLYGVNAVWIFNANLELAYSVNNFKENRFGEFPLPVEDIRKIFSGGRRFCHFFINTPQGVAEIRGSTIHPTADEERKTEPQGYFFAAQLLDKAYLDDLSRDIGSVVTILPFSDSLPSAPAAGKDMISISRLLYGADNQPLAQVSTSMRSPATVLLKQQAARYLLLFATFTLAVFSLIVIFVIRWTSIPLQLISKTLNTEDPSYLGKLRNNRTEFGKISYLINKFFDQRQALLKQISERRKAEETARESEERFSDIADNTGEWIWEINPEGLYTYSSRIVENILGYKPEEIVGKKYFYDFFIPEERQELKKTAFEIFAKGKDVRSFINRNIHKDGRIVFLETNGTPIIDNKGVVQGYRGADRDITERKQHEDRLARINDCLLSFGADPFINIQNLTSICGQILGGACAIYNRLEGGFLCARGQWNTPVDYNPVDKPEGHICYDVIRHAGDQPFIVRNLPQTPYVKTDPNVAKYNLRSYIGMAVKCRGRVIGSVCVVYQSDIAPSENDKKLLGIIASAIGVEEGRRYAEEELKSAYQQLKTTQAQLVQSAKMSSVGQLASGVAHEINNPLTGVLNNIQLIKMIREQKKEFTVADFNELLDVIEESALRCKKITQSLLDFSRASKGTLQTLSLNDVVERIIVIIGYEMKLQNIAIEKELDAGLPLVMGNVQLLQQVIFDLIANAKWAIEKKGEKGGGRIAIVTSYDTVSRQAAISVSDNGIGIAKDHIDKIFEPFFTTKGIGEGTGLGLAIVYGIIKEHKGTIGVESREGAGTTFKIRLPASQASL